MFLLHPNTPTCPKFWHPFFLRAQCPPGPSSSSMVWCHVSRYQRLNSWVLYKEPTFESLFRTFQEDCKLCRSPIESFIHPPLRHCANLPSLYGHRTGVCGFWGIWRLLSVDAARRGGQAGSGPVLRPVLLHSVGAPASPRPSRLLHFEKYVFSGASLAISGGMFVGIGEMQEAGILV